MDTTHTQFIASIILPLMLLICTAVYTVINYKKISNGLKVIHFVIGEFLSQE